MKKILSLIIAAVILCVTTLGCGVSGAENSSTVIMQVGSNLLNINGGFVSIDENNTTPVIEDGRTLVPVRAMIEAFDGSVEWDNESHTAILRHNKDEIRLTINSSTAYFNNSPKELDVVPVIINGRTMLPVRFIAESFGFDVSWDEVNKTITIVKNIEDNNIINGDSVVDNTVESENANNEKRVVFTSAGNEIVVALNDSVESQNLYEQLPVTIEFEDFNNIEKIAYLPERLIADSSSKGFAPEAGDLALYAPWGNISFFYNDYNFSDDLINLGKVESGIEYLTSLSGSVTVSVFSTGTNNNDNNVDTTSDDNVLIVYYSRTGITEKIANDIHNIVGGDIIKIETVEPYPEDYNTVVDIAQDEKAENYRPEINTVIDNIDQYDTVYIGYPIWWGTMPMAMFTFIESYNLDGKTIIPFSTSGGSGLGTSVRDLRDSLPNANVVNGFTGDSGTTIEEIEKWIENINN